jgi:osmotically-inducible protein OsmY
MAARILIAVGLLMIPAAAIAEAQSSAAADKAATQNVSRALIQAGIDPRVTSVQVVTTPDDVVHLSGLISNAQLIKAASAAATKAAPGYRVVNNIRSSFFDDPSHVSGDKTK